MFPKGSQILVHDFRHQNFGIWTSLGWVMAILVKKARYFAHLQSNLVILPIFFTKMAISQPKKVQISKFWCLKSCTNIWLPFGNIHSIKKINKIELEGEKSSKFAKIGQFCTLQKIKIAISPKFTKLWFHGFRTSQISWQSFEKPILNFTKYVFIKTFFDRLLYLAEVTWIQEVRFS